MPWRETAGSGRAANRLTSLRGEDKGQEAEDGQEVRGKKSAKKKRAGTDGQLLTLPIRVAPKELQLQVNCHLRHGAICDQN